MRAAAESVGKTASLRISKRFLLFSVQPPSCGCVPVVLFGSAIQLVHDVYYITRIVEYVLGNACTGVVAVAQPRKLDIHTMGSGERDKRHQAISSPRPGASPCKSNLKTNL